MKWSILSLLVVGLAASGCKKAADDTPTDDIDTDTDTDIGDGLVWPDADWEEGDPAENGLDTDALEALRAYAFTDGFETQSVMVIRNGVVVAEWYADGTDADTLVTSWSAAKSVTSAMVGVGIREGLISLDDPAGAYLDAWAEGENSGITIRNLLEMRSGLPENDSHPYGVYGAEPNQLTYSLDRSPVRDPGQRFSYVNEDSMVVGGALAEAFGEPLVDVVEREMFEPIGLNGEWWVDGAGNALTYCCIDTTARDFARFGLLFARNGAWKGNQIVPVDYVSESTTGVSFNGNYGLHWWTFGDVFAALGLHNQMIYVYPEKDVVVTRFGRYTRYGNAAVRTGGNYQQTYPPGAFEPTRFYELFMAAITD